MITGDMKQLEAGSSEIEKASADGKAYTVHMKERANEIQALARKQQERFQRNYIFFREGFKNIC